jgi:NADH-quinone oxidoreductase subunit N
MSLIQSIDYAAVAPPMATAVGAVVVLVVDLFAPPARRAAVSAALSMLTGLGALAATLVLVADGRTRPTLCFAAGSCSYVAGDFSALIQVLTLLVLAVVVLMSVDPVREQRLPTGEYYFLLLSSVTGMLVLPAARDLLSLLVALEVVSLPAFVLAGLRRGDARGGEAALKFFLFSLVATGFTAYGMSLVYGVTGSLQLDRVASALARVQPHAGPTHALAAAAVVLVVAGFAFKAAAVPFHFWVPDTYQGAPLPVAAFLSTASKAAGFAGLLLLTLEAFRPFAPTWGPVLAALSVLTMSVGNVVALRQWQLVRLLAWSTVAQAGYLLVPLSMAATGGGRGDHALRVAGQATLAYLAIYVAMNLGAFAVTGIVVRRQPRGAIAELRGLSRRAPVLAVLLAVFFTALAGLPPGVAGLFAKVVILRAAVSGHVAWLAVVAGVNTVVGLAYYLRVVATAFSGAAVSVDGDADAPVLVPRPRSVAAAVAVAAALVAVAVASVDPQPLLHAASAAVSGLRRSVLP